MLKRSLLTIFAMLFIAGVFACDSPQGKKNTGEVIDDAVITSTIKTKLLADSDVSGLDIDVDTNKGVVELHGAVSSETESRKAEDIARQVDGVVSVENDLVIDASRAD